jgi:primosomal protein N' (replication factor Y)
MLSKGHHFPKLTLVGIVNADQGLFGSDFRSDERLAQSIVQVAGRAGREAARGTVLIQTAFPEHRFWERLLSAGYAGVAADALAERQHSGWPPFSHLALLRASAHQRADALRCLEVARAAATALGFEALRVLGPVDAPLARKAGRYRVQLLLESTDRGTLHAALAHLRPLLEDDKSARRARWSIDVDPVQLF